ncbi:virulence-associated V antigen [Vibrio sagamiensis]|uniref:Type III secretion cytoplasmic LcrG inhibitor n=1 Tax=Vibrio sagamiensis NBRC 104589 TaxID=1219064 RepID=A0A511QDT3_9VIBR|nr:virulence-associated V antigen [Vibrio sagamiensis]GEM75468.1 hypothetical protein VSA01S_15800 [Vibrio sagamiensis NBRC 104589]
MTNLTAIGLNDSSLNRVDNESIFQKKLSNIFDGVFGTFDSSYINSSIAKLPELVGQTEEDSLRIYQLALENLKSKQQALSGVSLDTIVQSWLFSVQEKSSNGQIAAIDIANTANQTLAFYFQSWFQDQVHEKIDNRLSTDFIAQLRLGEQATQASQIGQMSPQEFTLAAKHLDSFIEMLASQTSSRPLKEYERSVLENAFDNLKGLPLKQFNNSDFLFNYDRFVLNTKNELQNIFSSMGVIVTTDSAQKLAEKIEFIPGISKHDLKGVLKTLSEQVKQPFNHIYNELDALTNLQFFLDKEIQKVQASPSPVSLSTLFSNVAIATVNSQIDKLLKDLDGVNQDLELPKNIVTIKKTVGQDISTLFDKMAQSQKVDTDFITRHKKLSTNLELFTERLKTRFQTNNDGGNDQQEYVLKGIDVFALIDASMGDRLDDQILFALGQLKDSQSDQRDDIKKELERLTIILNLFNFVQSTIHTAQSGDGKYNIDEKFKPGDFGYESMEEYLKSPEFEFLNSQNPPITTHKEFLEMQGLEPNSGIYEDTEDNGNKLSNLSTAISDRAKIVNTDVQLKTEEFSKINSDYNATIQAMNQIVQKFNSVLTDILRSY